MYPKILNLMLSRDRHVCEATKKCKELSIGRKKKLSNPNLKVEVSTRHQTDSEVGCHKDVEANICLFTSHPQQPATAL